MSYDVNRMEVEWVWGAYGRGAGLGAIQEMRARVEESSRASGLDQCCMCVSLLPASAQ